jgi:multiple sugar transport system ATP-binding protein
MDEPLSNLDANLRVQMRSEVLRIQRRLGVATLYVTHDQTEAMTMGDRVAVLRGGTLQQLAAPQELYEHPANLFVASFIGSPAMNLYEATVSASADQLVLSLGSQQVGLPAELAQRRPGLTVTGRKLVVGIRPEHLTVAPSGGAEAARERTLSVRAELIEALGNESLLHFSTDARTVRNRGGVFTADADAATAGGIAGAAATESVARVDPQARIAVGDQLSLAIDVDRLHFFDAESGDAIGAAGAQPAVPLQASS